MGHQKEVHINRKKDQAESYSFFSVLPLLTVATLLLNDHLLKGLYGRDPILSIFTGKLSDFAAAFFLPLFGEYVFSSTFGWPRKFSLLLSCILTVVCFLLLEFSTAFSELYISIHSALFSLLGFKWVSQLTADPWDITALIMVIVAAKYSRTKTAHKLT